MKQSGWRGSEDLWLDEAYKMLVESGVESVKVMPLAKALNMSRTSFYWHFEHREALLNALIQRWEKKNTGNLISQTERYAESISEAVLNLFDCWINPDLFDARMDFAIRNWAQQAPDLKKTLEHTDQERINAIRAMFTRFDFSEEQADTRAHTVYYTQIGYISMMVEEPLSRRLKRIPAYIETFTGSYPTESEIARFESRHQSRITKQSG
ncbi:TetR/AcrR family transcriptional regulator [Motiliproteus sp. MSK22-1]|uniref:TetR/AcrR family transcriptional regulator n=1 Tax=Motiliproteus sp. MSK22-1 TaxID=1897630 RepID=UPI000976B073|nr:TetR/AcrR family transcriptional regulator [Motiliproteus sp. MSK22-1]OMH30537.1 TetR family transcriptional regulator [Motiliproteus sp. MSK22-1]